MRKQTSKGAFVDKRIKETKLTQDRSVIRGKAVARNPSTGEWLVTSGDGRYIKAKSVASSDLQGKNVNVTIRGKIGQIAEMPGFL